MPIKLVVNVTQLKCMCREIVSPFLLLCWSKAPATARPINGKTEAALNVRINSPLSPLTLILSLVGPIFTLRETNGQCPPEYDWEYSV